MRPELHPKHFDHHQWAMELLDKNPVLIRRIADACAIEPGACVELLTEVLRYLNLTVYHEQRLTPSLTVDYAWHEFILCTKLYMDFCQTHFGKYIHHHPGGSAEENRAQFDRTISFYRESFGEPDKQYWGQSQESSCGPCESV